MREILSSLSPYWYYLIAEGIKKIEVRKTAPKADDWNKQVECYMTKDEKSFALIPKDKQEKYCTHFGKIGMRFVCDNIKTYIVDDFVGAEDLDGTIITEPKDCEFAYWIPEKNEICLSYNEIHAYGNGKTLYGWYISGLVIYDKPKKLSDFYVHCSGTGKKKDIKCATCQNLCLGYGSVEGYTEWCMTKRRKSLTRPPQSWMYLEE